MIRRRDVLLGLAAGSPGGAAVVLRAPDGAVLRCDNEAAARGHWAAPGSAAKPLLMPALPVRLITPCTRRLRIQSRVLDCTHTPLAVPVDAETALAASCNCWFAAAAEATGPHRVAGLLERAGARVARAGSRAELQLQVLGVEGVRFTPMALARAYLGLSASASETVRRGLARGVEQGTGQAALAAGLEVAGKTGTTREGAWFAGFAPPAKPAVIVVVYQPAGRGALHAAPVARELFEWWQHSGPRS